MDIKIFIRIFVYIIKSMFRTNKEHPISKIHALWLKASDRYEKNRQQIIKTLDKATELITPEQNGTIYLYANCMSLYSNHYDSSDIIKYSYRDGGYSHNRLNHSEKTDRKVKLAIMLNHDSLKLGNELYYYSEYLRSSFKYLLFHLLFDRVKKELEKKLKNSADNIDYAVDTRIVVINIDSYEYLIMIKFKRQHGFGYVYHEFEWIGENKIDTYNL